MNLDFGAILSRAWKITWGNKILWIFGILASLGGGSGGGGTSYSVDGSDFGQGGPQLPPRVERFLESVDPAVFVAIAIGAACLVIVIGLILLALSVIGRGGLIRGVMIADDAGSVTFGQAWGAGLQNFWRLFLIGLAVGVIVIAAALVTILPGIVLAVATLGIGLLCFFPLLCLFIVAAIILNIVAYFAQIAAVVENLGVMDALQRSWQVIRANVGSIIVLGLILIVVGGVAGLVMAVPLILVVLPPLFALGVGGEEALGTGLIFALACCAAYLPILLVLSGILETWTTSAWTLAYRQFTRPMASPGAQPAPMAPAA